MVMHTTYMYSCIDKTSLTAPLKLQEGIDRHFCFRSHPGRPTRFHPLDTIIVYFESLLLQPKSIATMPAYNVKPTLVSYFALQGERCKTA